MSTPDPAKILTTADWWKDETARKEFHSALQLPGVKLALQIWRDIAANNGSKLITVPLGASLAEANLHKAGYDAGYLSAIKHLLALDGDTPKGPPKPREPWDHLKEE